MCTDHEGKITLLPEKLAEKLTYVKRHRTSEAPFEVALIGQSAPGDRRMLRREYAAAVSKSRRLTSTGNS
ncbi:MAG: hypothetical protein HY332_19250 [Chloroflexi bacterium]|nr:hypothetical protein [Chloroflexota bacterium]